ncbi:23S rRNA m(5)U-1939 methyltransferase [Desulfuromusa kysingii]|uniref:23S rRNA m(5)U-1939 methyltransferase n=1 Tax=Desulfuromusa kysingii TaxID=37625 RepID=A0A1H4BDG9_9BACT|nr:23S rRNA (uracil(1939)-C(5))-methyltransferase RlmD [Desulfuromusa kysingii]SEA46235.1 23S rRNA m(5)U-1939 methyltransferase [Desulfuromusa kysingii]
MHSLGSSLIGQELPPLTIETLVNGGAGLARFEGRVVFIPDTAVGDVVTCRVTKEKKKFLEARIIETIKPSSTRCQPVCPVAGDCGGCQWQHLPYSEQLFWKDSLFRETLAHQCGIDINNVLPIIPAVNPWNYRSRVQVKCQNSSAGFITGFFRSKSHSVVAVKECPVIAPELNTLLVRLRDCIDQTPFAADIAQLDLGVDDCGCCSAVVHYSGHDVDGLTELLISENITAALFIKNTVTNKLVHISGNASLQIVVDQPPILLKYAIGSFSQINLEQNRLLIESVLKLAELKGTERVLDLYCGMGNFSFPLARRAKHVIGIEGAAASINAAKINSRQNKIVNVDFYNQSAQGALVRLGDKERPDVLVLDPPRSGAYATMKELQAHPVNKIIYISCDPQTLGRDLQFLTRNGYELLTSQPIDMFPQTYHCESISLLRHLS